MDFSQAVLWWENRQLRIFVLCSLFIQMFLSITSRFRAFRIPAWLRFLIWLAYLGSEAIAIYALAALFNLHTKEEWVFAHSKNGLQVLWAPILLVHLGGQVTITAYNIEDNELWRRHVITSVSQVAVAIYVFFKSFSKSKDPKYLGTAACLFSVGILKCIFKPWDLKRVSITSLVSSSRREEKEGINSLEVYVKKAIEFTESGGRQSGLVDVPTESVYGMCVDIAIPYSERLTTAKVLLSSDTDMSHYMVEIFLAKTFDRLYTKQKILEDDFRKLPKKRFLSYGLIMRFSCPVLSVCAIIIFCTSDKEAYEPIDVKITYILLFFTAAIDYMALVVMIIYGLCCYVIKNWMLMTVYDSDGFMYRLQDPLTWPRQVSQYNLIGYLVRHKKHGRIMKLTMFLGCKDYLDQFWCMRPSLSSKNITGLILNYLKDGWKNYIKDIRTYKAFIDNRGQWILKKEGCSKILVQSHSRPFDESVLLWHLATDFCFYEVENSSASLGDAPSCCKEMSNYMVYLLFVNPEMMMPGTRSSLFTDTYDELKKLAMEDLPKNEEDKHTWEKKMKDLPKNEEDKQKEEKKTQLESNEDITRKIVNIVKSTKGSGIAHRAWEMAEELIEYGKNKGEDKMWTLLKGVWVEMLCFSAARCRGYLHARSLGRGGEYLSHVWILLALMGMEGLAETMQTSISVDEEEEEEMGGGSTGQGSTSPITAIGEENV